MRYEGHNVFQVKVIYRKMLRKLINNIYKVSIDLKDLNHLDMENSNIKSIIEAIDRDLKMNTEKLEKPPENILTIKSSLQRYPKQFSFWERLFINN